VIAPDEVIRPILLPRSSVNHSAPSGPAVIPWGEEAAVVTAYSVTKPAVLIRPILFPTASVNQSAPSGPITIETGELLGVGIGYSVTLTVCADAAETLSNSSTHHNVVRSNRLIGSSPSPRERGQRRLWAGRNHPRHSCGVGARRHRGTNGQTDAAEGTEGTCGGQSEMWPSTGKPNWWDRQAVALSLPPPRTTQR
jgi:hypothetical protein